MTLWFRAPQEKSAPHQVWRPQGLWQWRNNGFSLSHDLTRPHDKSSCDFMGKACYHPAKFGGYGYSGSEVIMDLVCHTISQNHMIQGSCDFMGGSTHGKSPVCQVWSPQALWWGRYVCCDYRGDTFAHTYKNSGCRHNNLPICPMKDSESQSHMPTRTTDGTYLKNFCQSIQKQHQE